MNHPATRRRDHRGRFVARSPKVPVTGPTVAALLLAHLRGDREGVDVIVGTCDLRLLVDSVAEAAVLLGARAYGSRKGFDAAMGDLLGWLAAFEASRGRP